MFEILNYVQDRRSDLYIYGEMDLGSSQIWHIDRSDVILDTLLKNGHFANIYKARLKGRKGGEIVVAKSVKGMKNNLLLCLFPTFLLKRYLI